MASTTYTTSSGRECREGMLYATQPPAINLKYDTTSHVKKSTLAHRMHNNAFLYSVLSRIPIAPVGSLSHGGMRKITFLDAGHWFNKLLVAMTYILSTLMHLRKVAGSPSSTSQHIVTMIVSYALAIEEIDTRTPPPTRCITLWFTYSTKSIAPRSRRSRTHGRRSFKKLHTTFWE